MTARCALYMDALKIFDSPCQSLPATPCTATFPEIVNGLLLQSIVLKCVQQLRFVALHVPEIIGGTQKIGSPYRYAHSPFSVKFESPFVRMDPVNVPAKFEVRSFTRA